MKKFISPNYIYRIGGEEFAILLPSTTKKKAFELIENFRKICKKYCVINNQQTVTISGGISCYPYDAGNINDLIQNADQALYQAKKQGRDKICLFN